MQSLSSFYNASLRVPEAIHLGDRVEALRTLLSLVQREIESLNTAVFSDEKHMTDGSFCLAEEVERFEADLIRFALIKTHGHQRRAAQLLGVKATTLNIKIKKYEIDYRVNNLENELAA